MSCLEQKSAEKIKLRLPEMQNKDARVPRCMQRCKKTNNALPNAPQRERTFASAHFRARSLVLAARSLARLSHAESLTWRLALLRHFLSVPYFDDVKDF